MNKTIRAFQNDISSSKIKNKLLQNMQTKVNEEFVLNTVQLTFDFSKEWVEISYFIVDEQYPDVHISFEELKNILTDTD